MPTVTTGLMTTVAVAVLVGSATLAAPTLTYCCERIAAGAVYKPDAEIDPSAGDSIHVTAVLAAPVMVVRNCCETPGCGDDVTTGETEIATAGVDGTVHAPSITRPEEVKL